MKILALILFPLILVSGCGGSNRSYTNSNETLDDYEYPVGFSGEDTMYACNLDSGNCYDLEVEGNGEELETIYFPNGGWVDVSYSDCEDGYCYAEDENGTEWEFEY